MKASLTPIMFFFGQRRAKSIVQHRLSNLILFFLDLESIALYTRPVTPV